MGLNRIEIGKKALKDYDGSEMSLSIIKRILVMGGCSTEEMKIANTLKALEMAGIIKEIDIGLFLINIKPTSLITTNKDNINDILQ